jgi:hypothetical protein
MSASEARSAPKVNEGGWDGIAGPGPAMLLIALLLSSCSLGERSDFLIGRQCKPKSTQDFCDEGQACLPHKLDEEGRPDDFRCRDAASFELHEGEEPPLAYCDATYLCPPGVECRPDRVRENVGARPTVCKVPGDIFSPPTDAGI